MAGVLVGRMSRFDHRCPYPARQGQCSECRRLREMTRDEFTEWFRVKYDKHYCEDDRTHLTQRWAHQWYCVEGRAKPAERSGTR